MNSLMSLIHIGGLKSYYLEFFSINPLSYVPKNYSIANNLVC